MLAAMPNEFSTIARASNSLWSNIARAAACANGPPDPMAMRESSGSITSPLPEIMSDVV